MATSNGNMTTLYYLLLARYASDHIRSDYPDQWRLKIMSTVFMYGPTWKKELDIQDALRAMTDDEILKGSAAIYNNAQNPDGAPTTMTWDTLQGINAQNVTLHKRGKLEAYAMLDSLIKTDVTKVFIDRFAKYFDQMLSPQKPLYYDMSEVYPFDGNLDNVHGDASSPLFGNYITNTFKEMFPSVSDWLEYYRTCGIPTTIPEV